MNRSPGVIVDLESLVASSLASLDSMVMNSGQKDKGHKKDHSNTKHRGMHLKRWLQTSRNSPD
jgi:hypothetical protein